MPDCTDCIILVGRNNEMKPHPEIVPWFIGTWVLIGILTVWLAFISRNITLKKRLIPMMNFGVGILFAGFIYVMTGQAKILLFVLPAAILIGILNHHIIGVCNNCGRTITNNVWFSKMEYCSKCGALLSKKSPNKGIQADAMKPRR